MNWALTIIEAISWCILFTIIILLSGYVMKKKKNYSMVILDYPKEIVDRLIQLGKIKKEEKIPLNKRLIKKLPILLFYIVGFTCLLYFINGARSFLTGFLSSFVIMFTWTWYDALFLDCVIFCNTKLFVIEGTEDMKDAYHDYFFHIKASIVGTVLSIFGSLVIGLIIALIQVF